MVRYLLIPASLPFQYTTSLSARGMICQKRGLFHTGLSEDAVRMISLLDSADCQRMILSHISHY